ncbi:lipopolysaccharide biosynthesis protein [Actinomycetospora callitridis]|uniref:lipopolysaccharide biosynthesis protein n=1 Tax=Actinomycetospora callitridis TaxID=913944 RepID=UPI0023652B73|nr:lipopolysaccharide biosynthesis protein [Actinomycetospora callitridis]MDD7917757.1 lipopolysaccharide biosynthesis protein [Actinomycetospora callitridis]
MTQPPDSDGHPERGPERDPGSRDHRSREHAEPDIAEAMPEATSDPLSEGGATPEVNEPDEHNPSLDGLGGRLRRGAQFAAIALVFTQLISLGQTVVVARLLTPAEIGIFTLGTLLANFAVTIADGGMRAALIQREEDVEKATETAFWASLITGVLMSGAALAAAPLLGMFFSSEMVGLVCAATCGTLLIHSLVNVPEALLQRRFNFKRRLIVDPLTAGTFAVVTVALAFAGFGVWGMVIGLYASQLATLISCWVMCKWRPGKTRPSYRIWRELAGFSFPLIVSNLTDKSRELVQSTLIGRGLGEGGAGQYRYGRRIGVLPGTAIIQVASYVLFPAFSRIASDAKRFHDGFLRSLRALWIATIPFSAVLIALGQPMIVVLLGEQWRPAGLFVAAMAGYGPGAAMSAIGMESIKGAGKSRRIHILTGLSVVLGVGGLVLLLPYGLLGVGTAVSIDAAVGGFVSLVLARDLANVTWRELLSLLIPPTIAAVVAGVAVGFLEQTVVDADQLPILLGLLALAGETLLLLGIFLGVLLLIAPASVREVLAAVRRRGKSKDDDTEGAEAAEPDAEDAIEGWRRDLLDAPTVVLRLPFMVDDVTDHVPVRRQAPRPGPPPRPPVPVGARPPGAAGNGVPGAPPHGPLLDAPTTALSEPVSPLDAPTTAVGPAPAAPPANGNGNANGGRSRRLVSVVTRRQGRKDPPRDGS